MPAGAKTWLGFDCIFANGSATTADNFFFTCVSLSVERESVLLRCDFAAHLLLREQFLTALSPSNFSMLSFCDCSQTVTGSLGSVCFEIRSRSAAIPPTARFMAAKVFCMASSGVGPSPAATSSCCAMNFLFAAAPLSASSAFLLAATMRASSRHKSSEDYYFAEGDAGLGVLLRSLSTAVERSRPIWY